MVPTFKILYRKIYYSLKDPILRNSFILLLFFIIITTVLLSLNVVGTTYKYKIGDIAREDIRVPMDISYHIASETAMEKARSSEVVPLVFDKDQSVLIGRLSVVQGLFGNILDTLKEAPPIGTDDRTFQLAALKTKKARYPSTLAYSDNVLTSLLNHKNPQELRSVLNRILIYIYDRGILKEQYSNPLGVNNRNVTIRTINVSEDTDEVSTTIDKLRDMNTIQKQLYNICYSIAPNLPKDQLEAVYSIAMRNLRPNLIFNIEETKRRINENVKSVQSVMGVLKKGQTIAREGDTITTDTLKNINILNKNTSKTNVNYIIGAFILQLTLLLIFSYIVVLYYEKLLKDKKTSIILFSLLTFFVVFTFIISQTESIINSKMTFSLFLPIPFVTMIVAVLYDVNLSLMMGVYVVFFSFVINSGSFSSIILAFCSALTGAYVVGDVERRTEFLKGGLIVGIVNALIVSSTGLMEKLSLNLILKNVSLAMGNGLINSILALGVIPLYENLFKITTKFKLLELSDLNAPIFKRMLIKAPGTYNHSLMVANMAEAACKAFRGNSLLARVGGYYHDIGKIPDASVYIENKVTDKRTRMLSPSEYSKLIISHVEKGVEQSEKIGLPDSIIDFIKEHHGKSTMTYFYHQALELANNTNEAEEVHKLDFQYQGPKPSTRESAVVMLADSIEAASRSIEKPTHVVLEGLVKKIIYNKLNEGELEFSDLTMSELNKIQNSFLNVLYGIFHTRIEYPEQEEVDKLEEKVLNKENGD